MNEYWFTAFYKDCDGWTIQFKYSVKATSEGVANIKCDAVENQFEKENPWLSNFKQKCRWIEGVEEV